MRRYRWVAAGLVVGGFLVCALLTGCGEKKEKVVIIKERRPKEVIVVRDRHERERRGKVIVREKGHHDRGKDMGKKHHDKD